MVKQIQNKYYDAIVFAVAHDEFRSMSKLEIDQISKNSAVILDLKNVLPKNIDCVRL